VSLHGMINVVVTVQALESEVHSGMLGGPAPDSSGIRSRGTDR
jgi:hypothetical protein